MTASADRPYPPFELMTRVQGGMGEYSDPYRAYEQMGAETRQALLRLLPDDWSFDGKRVLDFGCGAGRTLRHFLPEAEVGEFWGAEVDAPSVAWMQDNLCPPLHAWRSTHGPPLGLEPESFDLIWTVSVFTHLPATSSLQWLRELHRLLKPGALMVGTYTGRWNSEFITGEAWDDDRIGMNVLRHNQSWDHGGPTVLMSDWWVRAHWGRAFEIADVLPQFQNFTWVLMRKRPVELTTEDLERPEDDPREYAALRHNLRQVQREVEQAQQLFTAQVKEVRREYESTLSWQLARLVRAARRRISGHRQRDG